MSARIISLSLAREIPLRARVEFTQFGITRAGRVIGISHDRPMRYDLRLEDGAMISNIPEPAIGGTDGAAVGGSPHTSPQRLTVHSTMRSSGLELYVNDDRLEGDAADE